ncbi:acyltransferase family protein [Paracoccus laeviglucosivorans]|uniref:Peptidoglycan/LPS O-acetylase OafA/YrhL, contains acyltransferase and SGNH-hydrolase domains n=1 Tax=Paracoccus laeviglucosivorans TaxID=1197861 RepID=A0A521ETC1_9RHOB|nr:acyltransferase [Paracoccus laeviglucosivorans]SMO86661.1 Peptidoglycan/LPS O-acetylase OafA/YrhL, contains acyltransferase and SGNH-hydrolase domains [Paracoccus laeviglucosivorans]
MTRPSTATVYEGVMPDRAVKAQPSTRGSAKLETLTGLRGFAVVVVFVSHAANAGFLPRFIGNGVGQLGVMLFFILSGFLMGMLYLEQRPDALALRRYVTARLGRVLPLFYLVVAVSVIATMAGVVWPFPITDAPMLAQHLFLLNGTRELWAVPVEIQFYAIFVLTWLFCQRQGRLSLTHLALVFGVLGVAFVAQVLAYHTDWMTFVTVFYYTPYFLSGMLIALARKRIMDHATQMPGWALTAIAVLAVLAFVAVNPNFRQGTALAVPIWADPLIWAAMVLVFVCSLVGAGPFRWLATGPLLFLGEISYGFYLLHAIFLKWAEPLAASPSLGARLAVIAGVGLVTAAVAWLSLTWFERPALKRAKAMA